MYNEGASCRKSLLALDAYMQKAFEHYEIIAVNDGSTDNTESELVSLSQTCSALRICSYPDNRGKGAAVREGVMASFGDNVIYTDCDIPYGTDMIGKIAQAQQTSKSDIVIGSRNISNDGYEGYTAFRKLASKLYLRLISRAAGFSHSDSQCGIKCFGNSCAQKIFSLCTVDGFAFDLEALMIAEKLGYKVDEYPVKIINHDEKSSKVNIVKDTFAMLRDIRRIKKRLMDKSLFG